MDRSYGGRARRFEKKNREVLKKFKLDWPNVLVPGGWDGIMRTFNASGYGIILVDHQGIVRSVNPSKRRLKKLIKEIYPEHTPAKGKQKADTSSD